MKIIKNKGSVVVLLVVAVFVWGLILYRVVVYSRGGNIVQTAKKHYTSPAVEQKDTLLLNYRDPFLGTTVVKTVKAVRKSPGKPLPPEDPTPPAFRFAGKMKKGKQTCLIIVTGNEARLIPVREKKIGDFYIDRIYDDSLQVSKGKKRYILRIEQ